MSPLWYQWYWIFYPCFLVKKATTFLISKELVEASRTYTDQQGRFELLTPAGLEVQIFVNQKGAKNVPAELKGKIREEVQDKGNTL